MQRIRVTSKFNVYSTPPSLTWDETRKYLVESMLQRFVDKMYEEECLTLTEKRNGDILEVTLDGLVISATDLEDIISRLHIFKTKLPRYQEHNIDEILSILSNKI